MGLMGLMGGKYLFSGFKGRKEKRSQFSCAGARVNGLLGVAKRQRTRSSMQVPDTLVVGNIGKSLTEK